MYAPAPPPQMGVLCPPPPPPPQPSLNLQPVTGIKRVPGLCAELHEIKKRLSGQEETPACAEGDIWSYHTGPTTAVHNIMHGVY